MHLPKNQQLISRARELRRNMTKEERHLWFDFLRYCTPRFRRQEIIGNFIADFYCSQVRLVIELDGSQHTAPDAIAYDTARTVYFQKLNIEIIRYSNLDVVRDFDGVCQNILDILTQRGGHPSVTFGDSSPQGEP